MAYDAFLKLDQIPGESQKANHIGEIDLMSFSWGATNSSSVGTGTGASTGKVNIHDFNVMKSTDSASPNLFQKACDGTVIATGVVTLQRQTNAGAVPYLLYNFTNVFVCSIQWSGSGGSGDSPMESIGFCFEQVTVEYTPLDDNGAPATAPIHGGWNVGTNVKA
jgi:type VI secretion system secreted protein Hcp